MSDIKMISIPVSTYEHLVAQLDRLKADLEQEEKTSMKYAELGAKDRQERDQLKSDFDKMAANAVALLEKVEAWREAAEKMREVMTAHHDTDNDGCCVYRCRSCKLIQKALALYEGIKTIPAQAPPQQKAQE